MEPKVLQNRPELDAFLLPYWEAFIVLSGSRPSGFGVCAIPMTELVAYLEYLGITDPDEREDMLFLIRQMDEEFLMWHEKRQKSKRKGA